jgi:hypothetical protein
MKTMSLTSHIEPDRLEEVARVLDEQVWPEYRELPNFVGLVELPADHVRRQVVGLSIWDGDLDASEDAIARFRKESQVSRARQLRWRHSTSLDSYQISKVNASPLVPILEGGFDVERRFLNPRSGLFLAGGGQALG